MATKESGEFERALARLEEIVAKLDDESIGLDESVDLFREAKRLAKVCEEQLVRAQAAIDAAATEPSVGDGAGTVSSRPELFSQRIEEDDIPF